MCGCWPRRPVAFWRGWVGRSCRCLIPVAGMRGCPVGQGLMAVALVIFARWNPLRCVLAALLFGAAGPLGPSLQAVGVTYGYHFFNAAPYILTLGSWSPRPTVESAAQEAPRESHPEMTGAVMNQNLPAPRAVSLATEGVAKISAPCGRWTMCPCKSAPDRFTPCWVRMARASPH